jgi:hypothetical protein
VIASDPQVGDAFARVAKFLQLGPGADGAESGLWVNGAGPDRLDHIVRPIPEAGAQTGVTPDRPVPLTWFVTPPADYSQVAWRLAPEAPGERLALTGPGTDEPASGLPGPAVAAPDRLTASPPGRPEQPAPVSPAPAPGTEPTADPEAAPFVTRFLPFDTAGLRDEVNAFLSELETVIQVVPDQLLPGAWESVAVIMAGAGAVVVIGKWRAGSARARQRRALPATSSPTLAAVEPGEV